MNNKDLTSLLTCVLLVLGGCAAMPPAPDVAVTGDAPAGTTVAPEGEAMTLGDHYLRNGDLDKALYFYAEAVEEGGASADLYFRIGVLYDVKGDLPRADKAYRKVLKLDDHHAGAMEGRGMINLKDRDYAKAADFLSRAIKANPRSIKAYNGLGIIADLERDHVRAETLYRTALQHSPDSVPTLVNRGYSRYMAGAWDDAQADFALALKLDPDNAVAHQNLGLLHARAGRYDEAVEQLAHVMSVAEAYNDIGYACMMDNQHAVAATFFHESIRLSPSYNEIAQKNLALNRKLSSQGAAAATQSPPAAPEPAVAETAKVSENAMVEATPASVTQPLNLRRWVAVPVLRVRLEASRSAEVLDRISEGRLVRIMREDEDWAFVKYWLYDNGAVLEKTGWVSSQFLSNSRFEQDS